VTANGKKEESMVELKNDSLVFNFPEIHPAARLIIEFKRTLRIPDDGKVYPLPPGIGCFPIRHVDDFATSVPAAWIEHGGVMLPMHQAEALWINFEPGYVSDHQVKYPFAIKVATGKINAVTGDKWTDWLQRTPQDYVVTPQQPWLDGYCVEKGLIRQFVAMPLGVGYSAEEQITGEAQHGGIQIVVYPMRGDIFKKRFPKRDPSRRILYQSSVASMVKEPDMALAPGGRMRQEIYADPYGIDDWHMGQKSRCFVHIANSLDWRKITGKEPPTEPPTAKEYTSYGLPWFDYYSEKSAQLSGSDSLNALKSVIEVGGLKGKTPLPENESIDVSKIIKIRNGSKVDVVREGNF
jgi:hypothetical protein